MINMKSNPGHKGLRRFSKVLALPVLVALSMGVSAAYAVDAPLIKVVDVAYHPHVVYNGVAMFGYSVTNPGTVPLSNITIADAKCQPVTIAFGDTNLNAILEPGESWQYACTMIYLTTDTTSTVTVTGTANGITATATATAYVTVDPAPAGTTPPTVSPVETPTTPALPNTGLGN